MVVYVWAYIYAFFNSFVSFLVFVGAGGGCGAPAEGAPVEGWSWRNASHIHIL